MTFDSAIRKQRPLPGLNTFVLLARLSKQRTNWLEILKNTYSQTEFNFQQQNVFLIFLLNTIKNWLLFPRWICITSFWYALVLLYPQPPLGMISIILIQLQSKILKRKFLATTFVIRLPAKVTNCSNILSCFQLNNGHKVQDCWCWEFRHARETIKGFSSMKCKGESSQQWKKSSTCWGSRYLC